MVDLTRYPNPLRLFTQTRDEWFITFVDSLNIPIHVFTSIRDTQLGQLMFAIETHRLKKVRAGEDPGRAEDWDSGGKRGSRRSRNQTDPRLPFLSDGLPYPAAHRTNPRPSGRP